MNKFNKEKFRSTLNDHVNNGNFSVMGKLWIAVILMFIPRIIMMFVPGLFVVMPWYISAIIGYYGFSIINNYLCGLGYDLQKVIYETVFRNNPDILGCFINN